jgi:hypothetical protein
VNRPSSPSASPKIQPTVSNESPQPSTSFWRFEDRGPFTLNGFGTTFYGMRDFRADGSHVTTEWIVLAYIPLIPVRSLRVSYRGPGEHSWYLGFGSSENYAVFEKRFPPNWKQVLCTYIYVGFIIGWPYFICKFKILKFINFLAFDTIPDVALLVIFIILCVLPFPIPTMLRRSAYKKIFHHQITHDHK